MPDINSQALAAAKRAVEQVKAKHTVDATCPDCQKVIRVRYEEPPADSFVTQCYCGRSNKIMRGVLGPPARVLDLRQYYIEKAAGKGVRDATFYAMYFTHKREGGYFGCPIDPREQSPHASQEALAEAMQRAERLYNGANAYVGEAFFNYPGNKLTYEQAVNKLKHDNPGFCEDVYDTVIHDNLRGMR